MCYKPPTMLRFLSLLLALMLLIRCGLETSPGAPAHPDVAAYISLLRQAEAKADSAPLTMLAMMRQLYYGESWSATDTHVLWRLVIPCSKWVGPPRQILGEELHRQLAERAETGGVDMGHIFAGLEAMVCPFDPVFTVKMSNEDFATWGGDLGAIAAAKSACAQMGDAAASSGLCGLRPGGQSLDFYTEVHLPSQDLEGDLDPLAMRAALLGISCADSRLAKLTLDRPLSEILDAYYFRPKSALGRARQTRNDCILELVGAEVAEGELLNRGALLDHIAPQVASFAEAYYSVIRTNTEPDEQERAAMAADARRVTDVFLTGLLQNPY